MIYIDSNGQEQPIEDLNDFHLKVAHEKAQRMANHLQGAANEAAAGSDTDEYLVARYVRIVERNLWAEMTRRKSLPLAERFERRFPKDVWVMATYEDVASWLNEQQENG